VLWNLIFHDHCIWNALNNGRGLFLEEFNVLSLIVPGVPAAFFAILASFNDEDNLILLHIG